MHENHRRDARTSSSSEAVATLLRPTSDESARLGHGGAGASTWSTCASTAASFSRRYEEACKTVDKRRADRRALSASARDFYAQREKMLSSRCQHRHARVRARGAAGRGGPPLDGSHRRDGSSCATASACAPTASANPVHRIPDRGLRHVRRDGALHPAKTPSRRMYQARINVPQQRKEVAEPKETNLDAGQGGGRPFRPEARAEAGRPQRSLPLRQRQEVQELLREGQRLRRRAAHVGDKSPVGARIAPAFYAESAFCLMILLN